MPQEDFICVVEDDYEIRETLKEFLEMEGFAVKTASNGRDALPYVNGERKVPSLILLDWMMPVMSGWEFIQAAQAMPTAASIPIVIVSAVADRAKLQAAKAREVLKKPVNVDDLIQVVNRYVKPSPPAAEGGYR